MSKKKSFLNYYQLFNFVNYKKINFLILIEKILNFQYFFI